ncbi:MULTISPECIES: hypothetical protein [Halomonadaceae]|uniref:hypothetical protein n=1 Tax=Halomonadaceae TaxID=28256 RepID=UPI0012F1E485|nr:MULTISPECIES: hypothetical protein [Halomonas]UEQ03034.1 hypothetical protein LMS44_17340 [Halomonas profundus]CAD5253253.1 conserved hypothetical protein [Halomonas sp. 113]CAD5253321.1 conserved hypothetical protein [Halomonas sp. 59]CAD5261510.1 conserved hypothetical protein [Halomonas sp. I3]CAD5294122.1 conserved hypothetical protein [Halomonas sp. 156]
MNDNTTDPLLEIEAMRSLAEALTPLDEASCGRVLRWAADRFGVEVKATSLGDSNYEKTGESGIVEDETDEKDEPLEFNEISDLYAAARPTNDPEKALVVGYWFQSVQGQNDFDAGRVNKELKHLGHGVGNITTAMTSLIGRKPACAMQTRKSGSSQQARKKYKLTHEGLRKVRDMVSG